MSALISTYEQLPFEIVSGKGLYVTSKDGRRYLDFYGGHAVCLLGHCPDAVAEAVSEQVKKLHFYSVYAPVSIREEAASVLAEFLPEGYRHIFFCNSGAEANENALKLSIRLTGREKLVAFKGSFHGRTLLAGSVTDTPVNKELKGWTGDRVSFLTANAVDELCCITEETAAVILEPVQSMAGIIEFSADYLKALSERCRQTGTMLIFDEVQTGMGRCGYPFYSSFCGIKPDIFTTAKGLAAGFPIGGLFLSDEVNAKVKQGDLGSTFGGGPLAMAALKATITSILADDLPQKALRFEEYLRKTVQHPDLIEIRGRGCLLGLVFRENAKEVSKKLLGKGVITGTAKDPRVLRLMPPIISELSHVDEFQAALSAI